MHIFNVSKGVKGFYRLYDYSLRWSHMITEEAKRRARILAFWENHGLQATQEAFGVGRSTLFAWQQLRNRAGGKNVGLNPKSKRPHTVRSRQWHPDIVQEIKRIRREHPNLGKEKVFILLNTFCHTHHLSCPKPRTIGRIIADDPRKMRVFPVKVLHNGTVVPRKRAKKQRKPKDFVATYPGHCGAFDTVERIVNGKRYYIITFTDLFSRFSFAWETTSHASLAAKEFFHLIQQLFPYPLEYILTDNGSEFAKHFDQAIRRWHKVHWHTYPKTPQMNAHVERFNRTIQEEFVDFHAASLPNPNRFNAKLIEYLLWYNLERPHWGLNLLSPVQFLKQEQPESRMWWPNTISCQESIFLL